MSEYGVTAQGFIKKRLDVILEEMHADLSEALGFNTRLNPKSFLNVLLTNQADKFAELWEAAEESYLSKYPSSAEGISLDHAAEFGGSIRSDGTISYYPITCTGDDGTVLPVGTRIASEQTPPTNLSTQKPGAISLAACSRFVVRTTGAIVEPDDYTISINGIVFRPEAGTEQSEPAILQALSDSILIGTEQPVTAEVRDGLLFVDSEGHTNTFSVILSSTLTTTEVSSAVLFGTEEMGEIILPDNTITRIISGPAGLKSVTNQSPFVAGRLREADDELRIHYAEKIFIRSRTMLESIDSAVLTVQGVRSCKTRQNQTHVYIGNMPPHSVEAVVDGDYINEDVAKAILSSKAGGIQSCHCCGLEAERYEEPLYGFTNEPYLKYADYAIETEIPDDYGNVIAVRFTKPIPYIVTISVGVRVSSEPLAVNCFDLIQERIESEMEQLGPGSDVKPQMWHESLYRNVSGIAYYDIKLSAEHHNDAAYIVGLDYNYRPVCGSVNVYELSDDTGV